MGVAPSAGDAAAVAPFPASALGLGAIPSGFARAGTEGMYLPRVGYVTGVGPLGAAIGDVNGDGKLDLVTPNSQTSTISVLFGHGDGSFGAAQEWLAGDFPYGIAIGDVSGDGAPDVVVSNGRAHALSVLLGNGDGSGRFGTRATYDLVGSPGPLALGDLNGDGRLDVVVSIPDSGRVAVFLGWTDGTLAQAGDVATGDYPYAPVLRDLDGDGKLDLVVTRPGPNRVSVMRGNGDGSFGSRADYPTGAGPASVAVGDLDGDGHPDLAVANNSSGTISVFLADGTGAFGARTDFGASYDPFSVVIGDLNGDGAADLAVTVAHPQPYPWPNLDGEIAVLLGDGHGGFAETGRFATGNWPIGLSLGDLDADGRPDMAVADGGSDSVSVLLHDPVNGWVAGVPGAAPEETALLTVAPNPARGTVRLEFTVARAARVRLDVLDVQGRRVARLVEGFRPAGRYPATWDGTGPAGRAPAGIYFVRLEAEGRRWVRRFARVR